MTGPNYTGILVGPMIYTSSMIQQVFLLALDFSEVMMVVQHGIGLE